MDGNISFHEIHPQHCEFAPPAPVRRPVLTVLVDLVIGSIERARSRRVLRLMDDRMLRDIGIDRGTAQYESDKPFWRG
jgi:uncharacterized protein YjiS (DUF1127 family)